MVACALAATACGGQDPTPPPELLTGDPTAGRQAILDHGCGTCHTIPGIRGADSKLAPPLTAFSQRGYVAGVLVNTPENLARWIRDPQDVNPDTAMPDVGVSERQARDIAAYLFTLR